MKALIVYKTTSGFTETYAGWIAEELNANCIPLKDLRKTEGYDLLIYGGCLHAVGINGYTAFKSHLSPKDYGRLIILAVGASPPKPEIEDEIRRANLAAPEEKDLPLFYFQGGFDFNKLNFITKIIMTAFRWKLAARKDKTDEVKGMLSAYRKPLDATDRKNIEGMLTFISNNFRQT